MVLEAQFLEVQERYLDVLNNKSEITGDSRGDHYRLVFALMRAGVICRGLTPGEIEGVAITFIEKHIGEFANDRL